MGFGLSLLAALMFAGANVLNRRASRRYNGPDAISASLSINVVLMVPVVAALFVIGDSTGSLHPRVLVLYAITGIFGSYLGRWSLYE